MVDTATTRNRFRKQEVGTNVNTWGTNLNEALDCIDQCLDGVESISLGGATSYTLPTSNYTVTDEAKQRVLLLSNVAASGSDLIVPSVEHWYLVVNNDATGTATVKTAAGSGIAVAAGQRAILYCNASNVLNGAPTVIGAKLKSVTAGSDGTDAVNKAQMEAAIAASVPLGTAGTIYNSGSDTTRDYFTNKLTVSGSLVKTTTNAGGNESTNIAFTFDEGQAVLNAGVLAV